MKNTTTKKILGKSGFELLEIKKILEQILTEAPQLNPEVRQFLVTGRDKAWEIFIKQQEKSMSK